MDLSVIIPVYQGEKTLAELFLRIRKALDGKLSYEILFIYDFGKDNSWSIIQELIRSEPLIVKGFYLRQNYGQHNALLFGMRKAKGRFIITMDEDLQHDPELIPGLIAKQQTENFDVVYGTFADYQHSDFRIWTSELLRKLLVKVVPGIYPAYSSFRLMKRPIAKKISDIKNSYSFIDGYIGQNTQKIGALIVKHNKRINGKSSYSFLKLIRHALFIILEYSHIIKWILFVATLLFATAVLLWLINCKVNNPPNASAVISLIVVGIICLMTGIMAKLIYYHNVKRNTSILTLG